MQTFLPYANFEQSLHCLDYKRLGKQRIEAMQILKILSGLTNKLGWRNHPAVLMWVGFEEALAEYHNYAIAHWISRGYNNTMKLWPITNTNIVLPPWFGREDFHDAHKSNLLRKDPNYYSQFNWQVPNNLPYIWPTKEQSY